MKKGQLDLVNKAVKSGFSEKEIEYLKTDSPLWVLQERYFLLRQLKRRYGIDEYEKICPAAQFMDILMGAANEYAENHSISVKNAFSSMRIACFYPIFEAESLCKILENRSYSIDSRVEMADLISHTGISYKKAEELYEKSVQTKNPDVYRQVIKQIIYDDKNQKMLQNLEIKESYAEYIASLSAVETDQILYSRSSWLKYALKHNIPLEVSINANFSYDEYIYMQMKRFSWIEELYSFPPYSFHSTEKLIYLDEKVKNVLENSIKIINDDKVKLRGTCKTIEIAAKISLSALSVSFKMYNEISAFTFYDENNIKKFSSAPYVPSMTQNVTFVFFYDGGLYVKYGKINHLVPMTIKNIAYYASVFGTPFLDFVRYAGKSMSNNTACAFTDILRYIEHENPTYVMIPPVSVNDCVKCYSVDNLMKNMYKNADILNWNKTDIRIGYLIMKSLSWVDKSDIGKLIAVKDADYLTKNEIEHISVGGSIRNCICKFLSLIIISNISKDTYWNDFDGQPVSKGTVVVTINDYIRMCRLNKTKISLRFKSAKKLKEAHDDLAVRYEGKHTPLIKVPPKSKFNDLRNFLPKDFEWIQTRKRIIQEGIDMRHCVASYASLVNADECAIYSFVYKKTGKRYTVEFKKDKNIFFVNQIQSMCDRGCPDDVRKYVNSFLPQCAEA